MTKNSAQRSHSVYRPVLPLFLYDLTAATQLLPPAAVLPEQFHGSSARRDSERGELALMRAVLEDAVHCFQKIQGARTDRPARDAEKWIFSEDTQWPFSFVNICTALGLSPEYVRLGLTRWRQDPPVHPARRPRREARGSRRSQLAA
ncbi:MAG: hypothetical protein AB7P18_34825 [Candidatus Binatia bacterium]